jgi:hypothetical protein
MARFVLACAAVICNTAAAQTEPLRLLDGTSGPVPVYAGAAAQESVPGVALPETEEQALRRQVAEALQARIGQMPVEQLRRTLAVIEAENVPLPPAAQEVLDVYRQQAGSIQAQADRQIAVHRKQAVADLKEIQDRLTRDGQLDEAVAVRDLIRSLSPVPGPVQPDPGSLVNFRDQRGKPLYFRLTGRTQGAVWGTDVYTDDSTLAVAAVHAGVLQIGQTGIVKATFLPGRDSYPASTRNGVTTSDWGSWSGSYRVERVRFDEELEAPGDAADRRPHDPAAVPGEPLPGVGAPGEAPR